jgi:hypothetical protein
MRYALMISSDEEAHVGTEAEQGAGFQAQAEKLGSRLVSSVRLRPTNTATTVRVRDGDVVIADGPFAETKEQIGGFLLVECEDLDEAIEVAAEVPTARYGTIEVRPVWEV